MFSAVTSAFIIDLQSQLQPDYTQMSYALLTIIARAQLGQIPVGPDAAFPQWNGPDPMLVYAQTILYVSLSASLLAAFIAMLGKQWLSRFSQLEIRGSVADRSRDRVRKFKGMVSWRFDLVMESLPLMLQISLLLLGYALSHYLFFLNKAIAGVITGFTAFGLLFYLLIVSAATLSYSCPFQTPLSLIIRFMIRFDDEHRKYLERCRKWLGRLFTWKREPLKSRPDNSYPFPGINTLDGKTFDNHIELPITSPPGQHPLLPHKEADRDSYALDAECIIRMFEISTDTDVIQANMKFISEITWHAGIKTIPLERVYGAVIECFNRSTGRPVVIPKFRNQAYLGAKALLHLVIQRQCFGDTSDQILFESISNRHQIIGSEDYKGDSDLESTLGVIDRIFGNVERIPWLEFSPTHPHLAWMAHTLLFRAWDFVRRGNPLPDDIREFVGYTLHLDPLPPGPIIADCLLIINLAFGIGVNDLDLFAIDKTGLFRDVLRQPDEIDEKLEKHLCGISKKVADVFLDASSTTTEVDLALEAMAAVTSIHSGSIFEKGRHLFHVVMSAPVTLAFTQEKKWQAARCVMRCLYRWAEEFWPWEGDPQDVLTFLDHHFDLATQGGENQDGPIQDALAALGYADDPVVIEALKSFDPTGPTFVRGIFYALQEYRPFRVRTFAFCFLAFIGDRWFNAPRPIMEPDQMKRLCADWASVIDATEETGEVEMATFAVLFYMMNSPHWRPHIVTNKWKLLESLTSVPDSSEPLRRCLDNLELTDAVAEIGDPAVMVAWLRILWLKYGELIPEVREKLETVTEGTIQKGRATDLDTYLLAVDSGLKKTEDGLGQHDTISVDPAAIPPSAKIDGLQRARAALLALKGG